LNSGCRDEEAEKMYLLLLLLLSTRRVIEFSFLCGKPEEEETKNCSDPPETRRKYTLMPVLHNNNAGAFHFN
jgi:hypothetical protein